MHRQDFNPSIVHFWHIEASQFLFLNILSSELVDANCDMPAAVAILRKQ